MLATMEKSWIWIELKGMWMNGENKEVGCIKEGHLLNFKPVCSVDWIAYSQTWVAIVLALIYFPVPNIITDMKSYLILWIMWFKLYIWGGGVVILFLLVFGILFMRLRVFFGWASFMVLVCGYFDLTNNISAACTCFKYIYAPVSKSFICWVHVLWVLKSKLGSDRDLIGSLLILRLRSCWLNFTLSG